IIIINEETGWIYGASGYTNEGSHERYVSVSVARPEQAYRSLTLVNHGTLIGDVILGSGPNFVELGPESWTWGDVFLGTGDSVVTLWAGAYVDGAIRGEGRTNRLVVQAGPPGEEPEIHWAEWFIEGFNAFEIASGHWVFPEGIGGRLRNGETLIRRGAALELDGIAELDLETGAVLAGNGTFIGDVKNWEGSVRPGESIGTLTIVGDYTHDADAVLDIEVDPSKPAGDPEEADLLYVTGKATIHGGKVQVTLLGPATYVSGQRDFTILKADGGVEGAFDEMGVGGELSPFLEFALSHLGPDAVTGADEVIFTIIKTASFSSVAETPNQKEVAGALDDMADGTPPDDMHTVLGELQTLDEDAARDALDRMSGEIYTWHGRLAQQAADGVARSVRSGRIPLTRGEDRLWFAQDANVVVLAGDKAYAGGQARTFAFTSGYALLQRDSGARLGVFGTLMSTDAAMPRRGSAMTGSGWALGVYGRYAGSWGYVDGLAAYGSSGYHATRDVTVGSEARRAEGSFGATVAAAAADAAFRPFDTPLGRAEITAGLTWMSSARPQVKETGAGSLSLLVDPGEDHSLRAHAGVRLWTEQTQTLLGLGAQPWFHLGWVQELSPLPRTVTARLQGLPDHAMTIGGAETPAGLLRLGAGVTFAWDDDPDASIHVQYTGEFASGVKDHALTVQGSIRF
ncbi:MAG: autotransporter domain-containing protein, partial [Limnochordales bacterium]